MMLAIALSPSGSVRARWMASPMRPDALLHSIRRAYIEQRDMSCLIIGCSGAGKSHLLGVLTKELVLKTSPTETQLRALLGNSDDALISAIASLLMCSPAEAVRLLSQCGVNSVTSWLTPFKLLSGGEQRRVLTALMLCRGSQVIDDFVSCLDVQCARAHGCDCCTALPQSRVLLRNADASTGAVALTGLCDLDIRAIC